MHYLRLITWLMAVLSAASNADEYLNQPGFGQPVSRTVSVSFQDSSSIFKPTLEQMEMIGRVSDATMIVVNGRTSTRRFSEKDETLALARALSARSWLIARGASPLKIMINHVSAADFIAENETAEGRLLNQRVDMEIIYVPTL